MAKKKQRSTSSSSLATSAAERRRERIASQRTSSTSRSAPSAGEKRRVVRKSWWKRNALLLIGGILLIVVIVIGTFIVIANSPSQQVGKGKIGPTNPDILKKVTTVKESVFANVKTGGVPHVLRPPGGNPPPALLTGKDGKPEIFFYSAEFCPLCAAERWSVTVALSRFGTFKQLPLTVSADANLEPTLPDIPTFTFVDSEYNSDYIDFVPLEAQNRFRQPLQTPSQAQQELLTQYNVSGFPFVDIANKYIAASVVFDPTPLKGLSQQEIANMLSDPTQDVTQKIVGAANYLTAAICIATNNQPTSVCNSDPIPDMRSFLATNMLVSSSSAAPVSFAAEHCPGGPATCRRRGSTYL